MAIEGQRTMSKTQHYRKVTKPLLERKRRARMNHYLDELKELIVETMESNGEHVTKLEKADILELTVEYLKSKKDQQKHQQLSGSGLNCNESHPIINAEKFRAGYTQAAYEVSKIFAQIPGVNIKFGSNLMKHLAYQLKGLHTLPLPSPKAHQEYSVPKYDEIQNKKNQNHDPSGNEVWRPW